MPAQPANESRRSRPPVLDDPLRELSDLDELRRGMDARQLVAINAARTAGHTWEQIGATTGLTRQAARQRWHTLDVQQPR